MWQEAGEAPLDDTETKGDEIQKLSVIQTLPTLLAEDPQTCIQRLIPKMQQTLPNASTEFHVAASSTFKTILEQKLVSPSTFTQTFLQSILNSLDTRDPVLAHAWLETLLDVIELLPTDVIRREILPVAVNKGQLSQPVTSRIMCCKTIGKICTRFDSQLIKKEVLPTVHSLCQDVNSDVRACICLQLRYVAEGLGAESVAASLLPSIVELASDEESLVRHASVQTIVHLLPHLQTDIIKSTISPLIKKSCDSALKADDSVICIISQEFGKLVLGLEKILTTGEKTWFVKYFQQLSQLGVTSPKKEQQQPQSQKHHQQQADYPFTNNPMITERYVECRKQCAYNMPAMFLFAASNQDDTNLLLPTFTALANDPFYMVRRTLACGVHEIARIMGPKNSLIKNDFIKLLKDDNEEVLQGLIPHVGKTLELFVQSQTISTESIDFTVMELGRALLKCEGEIYNTNNWRLSSMIFEQFELLPKCFPSDYIYTYFVPLSLNRALNSRPIPVKLSAGRSLLVFIRYNLKNTQRQELRNKLYMDFSRNSNCYIRMLFIRMMIEAIDIFSSFYFKEYFYTIVLEMCEDPIANIRLKVVTLLPSLKSFLRLPNDKKLLSNFEASVRGLMNNEKDRDVIFALSTAIRKLDGIDVRHEGQPSPAKLNKQDNEDMKKYEEEKKLLSMMGGKATIIPAGHSTARKSVTQNINRISTPDSSRIGKQTTIVTDTTSSRTTMSTMSSQKVRQTNSSMSDTFKTSRQAPGTSRNYDLAKASSSSSSASSNNLTSSWARLKSNSMLLTHLWEKSDHTNPNISTASTDYLQELPCGCYDTTVFVYPSRSSISTPCHLDYKQCPCQSDTPSDSPKQSPMKNNLRKSAYFDTSVLTNPLRLTHANKEDRHEHLHFFHPRDDVIPFNQTKSPNLAALRALTNAAHYNSCWSFSSMPEIPVTLLDDEFLVDTGMRIPERLSSSQSTTKIPNLQDIIYRNTRIGGNFEKRRSGVSSTFDKGKSKSHFSMHEECIKRSEKMEHKSNRLSMNFDDRHRMKTSEDDLKTKRYSFSKGKGRFSFDTVIDRKTNEEKGKRSSSVVERDKRPQTRGTIDRSKRHSANYSVKPPEVKDSKQKFKRHSLEVTDYHPGERSNRKRNFTLDVNHNQGSSKIPLRNSAASGSRTAPVTRASSPIRMTQMNFDRGRESSEFYEDRISRFSSSDEEVDKLCIRFAYVDSDYVRGESTRNRTSKLPVWVPRKKP